jgi:hypothetical protein
MGARERRRRAPRERRRSREQFVGDDAERVEVHAMVRRRVAGELLG